MHYHIRFPADFKNVPPLRDLGYHMAMLQGFDRQKALHIKHVIDEIISNAIEFGSKPESEVELELFSDDQKIKLTCQDQGQGNHLKAEDIEKKLGEDHLVTEARGRGLSMIVKNYMNEFDVRDRLGGGIIVTATLYK